MFPGGVNPRQMKQMMKKMGIKTDEIEADVVMIQGGGKTIVIEGPEVVKMTMQGQEIFNVTGGTIKEDVDNEEVVLDINDDDVEMVSGQAGVSAQEARSALEECGGDLAEAIMKLKG